MLAKIIGALLFHKTMADGKALMRSVLAGVAAALAFLLIATLILGILVVGGTYIGYEGLLTSGATPAIAALITGGVLLFLFLLCTCMIAMCMHYIARAPRRRSAAEDKINDLVDSFLNGFNAPRTP